MPTLDPLHPVQSAIVEVLSQKTGLGMKQLHRAVTSSHHVEISLPNVYRTVSQMIDSQILVRRDGKLSLNLAWIPHVLGFAEAVKSTYYSGTENLLHLPLHPNDEENFMADSLLSLDTIWSHILLKLSAIENTTPWYIYNSHPVYSLGMRDTETRVYQSLVSQGAMCHVVYGGGSFLDYYGEKLIRVPKFHMAVAAGKCPYPAEGYFLWSCGEHVVECQFPESINKHFRFFFQSVHSVEQFDAELFADVFRMKARCKLSVRRNAEEAEEIRKILKPFFGRAKKTGR